MTELLLYDILLRKSKKVTEGTGALSIRDQETRGRAWVKSQGGTVRMVWKENVSAFSGVERPKQQAALRDLLAGKVAGLWVSQADRWSRQGARSVLDILDAGARLYFDRERLDSSDERDRIYIITEAERAHQFSSNLSRTLSNNKAQQRLDGEWLSRAPYGLKAGKDRKLKPDARWGAVELIYQLAAEGKTLREIQAALYEAGWEAPGGGEKWPLPTISKTVRHPVYEGVMTYSHAAKVYLTPEGKRVWVVKKKHRDKLISSELAAKARAALQGKTIVPGHVPPGKAKHPLTGITRCEGCKGPMVTNGNNTMCSRYGSGQECHAPASIRRALLEEYVFQRLTTRVGALDPEDAALEAIARRWDALQAPEETAELREAQDALKQAQAALERFHEDDRKGFYTGRSVKYRIPAKLAAEEAVWGAEKRVAALSGGSVDVGWLLDGTLEEILETADLKMRRDLAHTVIRCVWVAKRGLGHMTLPERVRIEWTGSDEEEFE